MLSGGTFHQQSSAVAGQYLHRALALPPLQQRVARLFFGCASQFQQGWLALPELGLQCGIGGLPSRAVGRKRPAGQVRGEQGEHAKFSGAVISKAAYAPAYALAYFPNCSRKIRRNSTIARGVSCTLWPEGITSSEAAPSQ